MFNKNNIEITKAFAEALLEEKIERIEINEDKELIRERPDDKLGVLDLELDINDNKKVDVEIQLVKRKEFIKRLLWYFSKLYSSQIQIGGKYEKLKKVVLVAIVDFEVAETKEMEQMETVWKITETKKRKKILTDDIEIHIIELPKARNMYEKNKENEKIQWMLFIDNPNSKEVHKIMEKNKRVKEAVIKVKEMTEDEKMERLAFLRQKAILDEDAIRDAGYDDGFEEGKEDGIREGIKEGIKTGKIDMIKRLYSINMPIEQIANVTEMSIEEVKEVLNIK